MSRLETQSKMNVINKSFAGIVKSLERAMASNNLTQVSTTMDAFEKAFESLDVQSEVVQNAMGASTALSTPADQVAALMQEVAEEHSLEVAHMLPTVRGGAVAAPAQAAPAEGDDLSRRLAELKAR